MVLEMVLNSDKFIRYLVLPKCIGGIEAHIEGGRYAFTIRALTAEEDRVSAVVDGHARRKTGVDYNNNYHFLFTIADGTITAIREYHDTRYAAGVWSEFGTMPGSAG